METISLDVRDNKTKPCTVCLEVIQDNLDAISKGLNTHQTEDLEFVFLGEDDEVTTVYDVAFNLPFKEFEVDDYE